MKREHPERQIFFIILLSWLEEALPSRHDLHCLFSCSLPVVAISCNGLRTKRQVQRPTDDTPHSKTLEPKQIPYPSRVGKLLLNVDQYYCASCALSRRPGAEFAFPMIEYRTLLTPEENQMLSANPHLSIRYVPLADIASLRMP